jgi:hypothetical protein
MAVADVHVRRQVVHGRLVGDGRAGATALRAAVTEHLLDDLAGLPAGDGYWLVRRLELRTTVGAGWSSPRMSRALARSIGAALDTALGAGQGAPGVLWFPSRAAFLARFLTDLAADRTSGRWEYATLLADDASAARVLGRLAVEEPQDVGEALLLLSEGDAEAVLVDLVADQAGLLRVLAGSSGGGDRVGTVLDALHVLVGRGCDTGALLLALAAARRGSLALADVAAAALVVAQAVDDLGRGGPSAVDAVRHGRWADLARDSGLLDVAGWPAAHRSMLVDAVAPNAADRHAPPAGALWHTPFGGAFLLVPLLEDLGDWAAAARSWPSCADGTHECAADRAARLLCLAQALGAPRAGAAARDPVLRLLLGVPAGVDLEVWLRLVPHAAVAEAAATLRVSEPTAPTGTEELLEWAAAELLGSLGRRLPGMATASAAHLQRNVLDLDAWVQVGEDSCGVELGDPPLGVLVSMAGLNSGSLVVPGTEMRWTLTTSR